MSTTKTIPCGIGCALDEQRAHLKSRQRSWLGQAPRNSGRQIPLAEGMESKICRGDLVSTDKSGKLTALSEGSRFAGVLVGVGENAGHVVGSVKVGKLWEIVEGLTAATERGVPVFADPENQSLNLVQGVRVGALVDKEPFGNGFRGHIELEPGVAKIG